MARGLKPNQAADPTKILVAQSYVKEGKEIVRPKWVNRDSEAAKKYPLWTGGQTTSQKKVAEPDKFDQLEPTDPKRRHQHEYIDPKTNHSKLDYHPVGIMHDDDLSRIEHRNEIAGYGKKIKPEPKSWLDELGVEFKPTKGYLKGKSIDVDHYSHPEVGDVYTFDTFEGVAVVSPKKKIERHFDRATQAHSFIQQLFESQLHKAFVMGRIDSILTKEFIPAKEDKVFYEYKSGNNVVILQSNNNKFDVIINGGTMLSTESFQNAICRYYHEIANLIDAHTNDKDIALDLLGEKIVQINRVVLPRLAQLGKMDAVKFVKSVDISLIKAEPATGVFHGLPLPEEMGHGADETGSKPTKSVENFVRKTDLGLLPPEPDKPYRERYTAPQEVSKPVYRTPREQLEIIGKQIEALASRR